MGSVRESLEHESTNHEKDRQGKADPTNGFTQRKIGQYKWALTIRRDG